MVKKINWIERGRDLYVGEHELFRAVIRQNSMGACVDDPKQLTKFFEREPDDQPAFRYTVTPNEFTVTDFTVNLSVEGTADTVEEAKLRCQFHAPRVVKAYRRLMPGSNPNEKLKMVEELK